LDEENKINFNFSKILHVLKDSHDKLKNDPLTISLQCCHESVKEKAAYKDFILSYTIATIEVNLSLYLPFTLKNNVNSISFDHYIMNINEFLYSTKPNFFTSQHGQKIDFFITYSFESKIVPRPEDIGRFDISFSLEKHKIELKSDIEFIQSLLKNHPREKEINAILQDEKYLLHNTSATNEIYDGVFAEPLALLLRTKPAAKQEFLTNKWCSTVLPLEFSVRKSMTKEEITTFILQQYYDSIETSSGSLNDYMESVCYLNDLKEEELVGIYELQDISLQTGSDLTLEKLAPIKSEIEHKKMIRRNTVRFIKELEKSSESSLLDSQTRDSVKEIGNQILKKISFFLIQLLQEKKENILSMI